MLGNQQTALRATVEKPTGVPRNVQPGDLGSNVVKAFIGQSHLNSRLSGDVLWGCSDQAGEFSRKVGGISTLLIGLPSEVHDSTINGLRGPGLDSIIEAPNTIWSTNADDIVPGSVETTSQTPYSLLKLPSGAAISIKADDTTLSWRYPNPKMQELFSLQSNEEKAEYEFAPACRAESVGAPHKRQRTEEKTGQSEVKGKARGPRSGYIVGGNL
jgi:3-oxo-5,6-didehydrosuberyl-CoA/3-oxoadipyl-CoA thiolase